jgi:hypothetical protein
VGRLPLTIWLFLVAEFLVGVYFAVFAGRHQARIVARLERWPPAKRGPIPLSVFRSRFFVYWLRFAGLFVIGSVIAFAFKLLVVR